MGGIWNWGHRMAGEDEYTELCGPLQQESHFMNGKRQLKDWQKRSPLKAFWCVVVVVLLPTTGWRREIGRRYSEAACFRDQRRWRCRIDALFGNLSRKFWKKNGVQKYCLKNKTVFAVVGVIKKFQIGITEIRHSDWML